MNHSDPVREIVALFGGLKKMALALGHKNHSTIYGWVRSGKIPEWRAAEIQAAQLSGEIHIPEETYKAAFYPNRVQQENAA